MEETKTTIETTEPKAKAKTKTQLLAEKMEKQRVAQTAFDAGAKPIIETNPPEIEPETTQDAPNAVEAPKDTSEVKEPSKGAQGATETTQTAPKQKKTAKDTPKQKKAATAKKTASDAKESTPARLLDTLPKRKRIEKKTNAYYLSVANIEKLEKTAVDGGFKSASDLLDSILTAVLSE